jgi:hypothetical protein
MRVAVLVMLFSCFPSVRSQTPVDGKPKPEAQLSPQAAYDQATRRLEMTRRSTENWSEVELSALKVAREQAKASCIARDPDQLAGQDLIALAHLCAFAQDWQMVRKAASNYLGAALGGLPAENPKGFGDLSLAFDYMIQAALKDGDTENAVLAVQDMLRKVPYDEFASEATNSTVNYIRFIHTDQALALLAQRQPILLSSIKDLGSLGAGSPKPAGTGAPAHPTLPLHTLYADAIAFPTLQQFADKPKAGAESYAELDSALPSSLTSEDAIYIDERRRQYLLIGTHMPPLHPMGFLLFPGAAAPQKLNTSFANATVFLLFPDWCNQCITIGFNSQMKSRELVAAHNVRFFPLLAQADPPEVQNNSSLRNVPLATKTSKATLAQSQKLHVDQQLSLKSTPDSRLEGTPTIVVPNEALDIFAATDFPLVIATDHSGVVRWIQPAQDDALEPGGDIDHIVQHILATWPPD